MSISTVVTTSLDLLVILLFTLYHIPKTYPPSHPSYLQPTHPHLSLSRSPALCFIEMRFSKMNSFNFLLPHPNDTQSLLLSFCLSQREKCPKSFQLCFSLWISIHPSSFQGSAPKVILLCFVFCSSPKSFITSPWYFNMLMYLSILKQKEQKFSYLFPSIHYQNYQKNISLFNPLIILNPFQNDLSHH